MANDETLAALERAAARVEKEAQAAKSSWLYKAGQPMRQDNGQSVYWKGRFDALQADAALIRALIERERGGGERPQIVAWLRCEQGKGSEAGCDYAEAFADQIEAGAHLK